MATLEALSAKDLGLLINGVHFVAVQDLTEESRQEITWRGGFGHDGPILRSIRGSDEDTMNFTAIVLRAGAEAGLNRKDQLQSMRDFEVQLRQGNKVLTKRNCNWTRISTRNSLTEVMLDCDISIPGVSNINFN